MNRTWFRLAALAAVTGFTAVYVKLPLVVREAVVLLCGASIVAAIVYALVDYKRANDRYSLKALKKVQSRIEQDEVDAFVEIAIDETSDVVCPNCAHTYGAKLLVCPRCKC